MAKGGWTTTPLPRDSQRAMTIDSAEAIQRLREGNRRFVEQTHQARTRWDPAAATEARPFAAVRANVLASVAQLSHGSKLIERLVQSGRLRVVGAEYELETGRVRFFMDD